MIVNVYSFRTFYSLYSHLPNQNVEYISDKNLSGFDEDVP